MVRIKICGITNIDDALAAARIGADAIGFNFYPKSPRYIEPEEAQRIAQALPDRVLRVGVFVNEDIARVWEIVSEARLQAVQLHGDETPEYCAALRVNSSDSGRPVKLIKALRVGDGFHPDQIAHYRADAILLDAASPEAYGGTGRSFDWDVARRAKRFVRELFLAGGLNPASVGRAIAQVQPDWVDVCSSLESAPGKKDRQALEAFVRAVRMVERRERLI